MVMQKLTPLSSSIPSDLVGSAVKKLDFIPYLTSMEKAILANELMMDEKVASGFIQINDSFIKTWINNKLKDYHSSCIVHQPHGDEAL